MDQELHLTEEEMAELPYVKYTEPFLQMLLGDGPGYFACFDDAKTDGKAQRALTRVMFDRPDNSYWKFSVYHYNNACGLFMAVNETDELRRDKAGILSLRAWWADLDDKNASEPFNADRDLARLPLPPTMVVQSGHGTHLYWVATEPMGCRDDMPRKMEHEVELKAIATALRPFGADPQVCDVARVMRVPGTWNMKDPLIPFLTKLVIADGPRYTREQIRAAFPVNVADIAKARQRDHITQSVPYIMDRPEVMARAAKYLDTCEPAIQGKNGSRATFNAALKILDGFDLSEEEAVCLLRENYNIHCEPEWSLEELRHKVKDAAPHCRDRGHLLRDGKQKGGPGSVPASPRAIPAVAGNVETISQATNEMKDRPQVPGYEWGDPGLFKIMTKPSGEGGEPKIERTWIAPPFTLPGLVRNETSQGWRALIAWQDLDGTPHEEAVPFDQLYGEGTELVRTLGQGGLVLPPDAALRKLLLRYLCRAIKTVQARVRLVEALGWHEGAFILPSGETMGLPEEPVRFAGDLPGMQARATRGTLEGWQQGVARYAVRNPRLAFALASAFAGPLLNLVRPDGGGGFNLMGFSSKGKSTCLEGAASVWGRPDPLTTWRATGNGLEGIAAIRNDGFLVLDELSQVDPKEAGAVAYMLANGSAKARANREGGARTMRQWRLIFLSSGEQGLEDKMLEDGKRTRAGQEVRVPDIPCPAEGMFEDPHELGSLGALAEHLKSQARKRYGHAARAFLKNLCGEWERREALQTKLREMEAAWLASAIPPGSDAQVRRVAGRFALVAVAGELAQRMEILPWPEGESSRAALVCFKAWLDRRGFTGASEVHRGIEAVLTFLERNGQARFDEWGDRDARIINRAGTRKRADFPVDGWDHFITPSAWKEACQGFNASSVAKACADAGILEPGHDGKHSRTVSIPGHGKPRCYVIRAAGLANLNKEDVS